MQTVRQNQTTNDRWTFRITSRITFQPHFFYKELGIKVQEPKFRMWGIFTPQPCLVVLSSSTALSPSYQTAHMLSFVIFPYHKWNHFATSVSLYSIGCKSLGIKHSMSSLPSNPFLNINYFIPLINWNIILIYVIL